MPQLSSRNSSSARLHDPLDGLVLQVLRQAAETYPPCDITQVGDRRVRIVVAVAGFAIEDLSVSAAGKIVVVRGRRPAAGAATGFLHRGIALRQFQRTFALNEDFEVLYASLDRGLLTIELKMQISQAPMRTITIGPERSAATRNASTPGKARPATPRRAIAR